MVIAKSGDTCCICRGDLVEILRPGRGIDRRIQKAMSDISGDNKSKTEVAMTAPVTTSKWEKIEMTAPVTSMKTVEGYLIAFVMPEQLSLGTSRTNDHPYRSEKFVRAELPSLNFPAAGLLRRWTNTDNSDGMVCKNGLVPAGRPSYRRYDPPFMPWFLRRNEIQIEIRPEQQP